MSLLNVKNLNVCFNTKEGKFTAVRDVSFSLEAGEVLSIVGESGSGKSVSCNSILGLIPSPPGEIVSGVAEFNGQDLLTLKESKLREIRGNDISMIFQEPMTSLTPHMTVGNQLIEAYRIHRKVSKKEAWDKAVSVMNEVGIREAEARMNAYPHEFSGGMRQRVMIAMALITEPKILIADEPTTALDVTVQAQILSLIKKLQSSHNLAVIFISHDLAVVKNLADHVIVMKKGDIVEQGKSKDIFENPQHEYTKKLLSAVLTTGKPEEFKSEDKKDALVTVKNIVKEYHLPKSNIFQKESKVTAVNNISLDIHQGEILGLVGESGSGKSTLGRCIIRLIDNYTGSIVFNGNDLANLNSHDLRKARAEFQMIFQDPFASLNPRLTVFDTLAEPMLIHANYSRKQLTAKVNDLLDEVGLDRKNIRKYPHEFSGGQRQRIAIARALACKPKFIVADEPVSALDVTIQAQILELLLNLTKKYNLTMLFVSHDLSVIRYICDRVVVMNKGQLIESGETETLFHNPQNEYTQKLLQAIPVFD